MNRTIISLIVLLAGIIYACNGNQNKSPDNSLSTISKDLENIETEGAKIELTVKGYNSGKAYLVGYYTGNPYLVDSTEIQANGKMTFKSEKRYQSGYYFVNLPDNKTIQLLLDVDQEFIMNTDANNIVKNMKIEGSVDNLLMYEEFIVADSINTLIKKAQKQREAYNKADAEYKKLSKEIEKHAEDKKEYLNSIFSNYPETFFTKFKRAGQNPDVVKVKNPDGTDDINTQVYLYRNDFWNNVDFSDNKLLYTPVISNKLNRYIKDLTAQNPDSIIASADYLIKQVLDKPDYFNYFANWITIQYDPGKTTLMDGESVYVHMINNYFTYERAFWSDSTTIYRLQKKAEEMSASRLGIKGPNVISKDQNGNTKSIYEIKDPYIVVFMFSPDCEHCLEQIPKLRKFYNVWKNRGVEVFAIALDTETDTWKNFIVEKGMTDWINVWDPTNLSIYAKYYVDITPEIYVLNPERTIIGKNLKVNQIETIINRDQEN